MVKTSIQNAFYHNCVVTLHKKYDIGFWRYIFKLPNCLSDCDLGLPRTAKKWD